MSLYEHERSFGEWADSQRQSVAPPGNYFIRLREDSPFFGIFSRGFAPVKQVPLPNTWKPRGIPEMTFVTCALCGEAREPEPCLWLDWNRCSDGQANDIGHIVCELRGGSIREFLSYMDRGGDMPVRVSQVDGAPFLL